MEIGEVRELLQIIDSIKETASRNAISSISLDVYCSPETGKLSDAMSAAQGAFKPLVFDRRNAETKEEYADLEAIIDATREALSTNKVFFSQLVFTGDNQETLIRTRIQHSEQWMEAKGRVVPIRDDPRTTDSLIQYVKTQAAKSILGIAGRNDTSDDDGVRSLNAERKNFEKGTRVYEPHSETELLSKDQIEEMTHELDDSGFSDIVEDIFKTYRVEAISDLPRNKYREIIDKIRLIKARRAGFK
jgi:hypothetical protein